VARCLPAAARRGKTGGPQHRSRSNPHPVDGNAVSVYVIDATIEANLDAQALQGAPRSGRKSLGKGRQQARRGLHQNDTSLGRIK
jgi:hypothetical protein